jgi:hypothetical protein
VTISLFRGQNDNNPLGGDIGALVVQLCECVSQCKSIANNLCEVEQFVYRAAVCMLSISFAGVAAINGRYQITDSYNGVTRWTHGMIWILILTFESVCPMMLSS